MSLAGTKWIWTKIVDEIVIAELEDYDGARYSIRWSDLTEPTTHREDEVHEWVALRYLTPLTPLMERLLAR